MEGLFGTTSTSTPLRLSHWHLFHAAPHNPAPRFNHASGGTPTDAMDSDSSLVEKKARPVHVWCTKKVCSVKTAVLRRESHRLNSNTVAAEPRAVRGTELCVRASEWLSVCVCVCVRARYEVGWVVPTECSLTQRYSHLISSHLGAVRGSGEAQQQFTPHRRSCRSESSTCSQHQSLPHCDEPGVVLRDQSEPDVPRESFPYMQWATRFEG